MNAVRAPSFVASSSRALNVDLSWPKLPAHVTLDRVVGIGTDSHGRVYVAHRGDNPLLCLSPDGMLGRELGASVLRRSMAYDLRGPVPIAMPQRYWLHGLHVDGWDNVWITDVSRHLVMKFDPDGKLLLVLGVDGDAGNDDVRFNQPTHVWVSPSGEFFVTDGYGNARVIKFNAKGERVLTWGSAGTAPGQFDTPHAITADAEGKLYVTDRGNDRIQVFDQAGELLAVWSGLHGIDGLFATPDGSIHATCGVDHALVRLDHCGQVQDVWVDPNLLTYPHALAVTGEGTIYIADTGDNWVLDPNSSMHPRRKYDLAPRLGAEGSRAVKLRVS